jgi:hypothetical protein
MTDKLRLLPSLIVLIAALSGCGPTPPQAPLGQAKKLDESLGGISTACGLSQQVTAFPGHHQPNLSTLEDTAISDAQKLASVYARNPKWIYQSDTVRALVRDSISTLHECGLHDAAAVLMRATGQHGL